MRRRKFVTLLSGVIAWPFAARAQQPAVPVIGLMGADPLVWNPWTTAFVERLRELGWIEGRNVAIEYRWNEGRPERITEIANEFVRLKVAVIVTAQGEALLVKRVTSAIPIVFAIGVDPVGSGLVASLAKPGGNITGLSNQSVDIAGKRLELLREVVPPLHRLAIIFDVNYPSAALEASEVHAFGRTLDIEVVEFGIRRAEDIAPAFETFKTKVDALEVIGGALIAANRTRIITLALGARLPTMFNSSRDYVQAGGLMSYSANFPALFRRAAEYVDKILRGAKPGDIPVEQPTKFDFVINLTTAKALGIIIQPALLGRADEVIE